MRWITRERIRVGRIGCAWLITRFIDPDAELYFVSGAQFAAETERLQATPFHVEGSGLERQGDRSSFEVMLQKYDLTNDPALVLLGRIVTTADIRTSPDKQPEGPGLKAITEGLLALYADDHALFAVGAQVYDALYAFCQEQARRGRAERPTAE
ncbi:MAG TPA: chromate resistance protein ChrB domain-containing protein [Roseiflexaceae bacterium]|nr:chromate resistance protein ChrB domain-containing protein [Roseiflexaceae bacterium]